MLGNGQVRGYLTLLVLTALIAVGGNLDGSQKSPTYRVLTFLSVQSNFTANRGVGTSDFLSVDSGNSRIYVSHNSGRYLSFGAVEVIDQNSGRHMGQIPGVHEVHGVALAHDLNLGFVSSGGDDSVRVFDLRSLETLQRVPVTGTDFILYDSYSKRVFPFAPTTTVLDAGTRTPVGRLDVGGVPEIAVTDGRGTVYLEIVSTNEILVFDSTTLEKKHRWQIPGCEDPHSLGFDVEDKRLFIGCRNNFAFIMNSDDGSIVARVPIGSNTDGPIEFDPDVKCAVISSSNASPNDAGAVIVKENTANDFEVVQIVDTDYNGSANLAYDSRTKNIYLTALGKVKRDSGSVGPEALDRRPEEFGILILSPSKRWVHGGK